MNIIGYSGFHNSIAFKQQQFPNLSPREYRLVQGLDSAAALVTDAGIIAAAAEERFCEQKGVNTFPAQAINYCLQASQLAPDQIDYIAHGFDYPSFKDFFEHTPQAQAQFARIYAPENQRHYLQQFFPHTNLAEKLVTVPHHLAHAASAYYVSGFDESLILVIDGMGEVHSTTVAVGQGRAINILKTVTAPHSLGILYGVVTLYLGFWMNFDEYKVMGLAPYGNPRRYFNQMMDFVQLHADGTYTVPLLFHNATPLEQETYRGSLRVLTEAFGPPRQPDDDITQHHKDVAAALQAVLQAGLMHLLRFFKNETGQTNLCLAGGVALNCTANGLIKRSRLFNKMFVPPAAADDGVALGAALYAQHQLANNPPAYSSMRLPALGPQFTPAEVEQALRACPACEYVRAESEVALIDSVGARLAAGQVVAWFQGRLEYGPRALGNRSILADPRRADMRVHINRLVKKREGFRPFAPAVTIEAASDYFEIAPGDESLYIFMVGVTQVKPAYREALPAITHVDGSARVQTVAQRDNPRFWQLLNKFGQLTGMPVLLNTSFNVRGQPIICTPATAIDTFVNSEIDALVLEDFIVTRCQNK